MSVAWAHFGVGLMGDGGEGWIRTSVRETRADLQSAAFNHSATSPGVGRRANWRRKVPLSTRGPKENVPASLSLVRSSFRPVRGLAKLERVKGIEPSS